MSIGSACCGSAPPDIQKALAQERAAKLAAESAEKAFLKQQMSVQDELFRTQSEMRSEALLSGVPPPSGLVRTRSLHEPSPPNVTAWRTEIEANGAPFSELQIVEAERELKRKGHGSSITKDLLLKQLGDPGSVGFSDGPGPARAVKYPQYFP